MAIQSIDLGSCNGCGICVRICPNDVFKVTRADKKPSIAYQEDCTICRLCEEECKPGAISVSSPVPKQGSETFPMRQYLIGLGITVSK